MGHRCGYPALPYSIYGPSLLPRPGTGRQAPRHGTGAGDRNGGHRKPGRTANRVARNGADPPGAVTFTLCAPEPAVLRAFARHGIDNLFENTTLLVEGETWERGPVNTWVKQIELRTQNL